MSGRRTDFASCLLRYAASWLTLLLASGCSAPNQPQEAGTLPDIEYLRGVNAMAQERSDWARVHFQRQLELRPDHRDSLRQLGLAWNSGYQQSLSLAIDAYVGYLARWPEDAEIRARLLRALLLLGRGDEARQALDGLPQDAAHDLLRFDALLDSDIDAAGEVLDRLRLALPDTAGSHAAAARWLERRGDLAGALSEAAVASQLDPLDAEMHYLRGRLLRRLGEPEASDTAFAKHRAVGTVKADQGEPREALAALQLLEAGFDGSSLVLQQEQVRWLLSAGRLGEAGRAIDTLLQHPKVTTGAILKAAVQADARGLRGQSQRLFEMVKDNEPEHDGAQASLILLALDSGDFDQAAEWLAQSLARRPDLARYHLLAARLAKARDRPEEALSSLQRALSLAPWEAGWRIELADLMLAAGDRRAARQLIDEAPESAPILSEWAARRIL